MKTVFLSLALSILVIYICGCHASGHARKDNDVEIRTRMKDDAPLAIERAHLEFEASIQRTDQFLTALFEKRGERVSIEAIEAAVALKSDGMQSFFLASLPSIVSDVVFLMLCYRFATPLD
jgi:hypothetical protein